MLIESFTRDIEFTSKQADTFVRFNLFPFPLSYPSLAFVLDTFPDCIMTIRYSVAFMLIRQCLTKVWVYKGVGSLTAELGPIFGRKLNVRFTFYVWSTFEKQVLN